MNNITAPSGPLVTALVSTFDAEHLMAGCLENLAAQTLAEQGLLEAVVVDSGSTQDEKAVVERFMKKAHLPVSFVQTQRETLYAAWNRGAQIARGRFLVNANTDDRHHPEAFAILARTLQEKDAALAYADALLTRHQGETYADNTADRVWDLPDYTPRQALMDCIFGPVTMWRASVHAELQGFDPTLTIAGDYEFFLRAALAHGAEHVPLPLGLFHESDTTLSGDIPTAMTENYRFLIRIREQTPLEDIYPFLHKDSPKSHRLAAVVDYANLLLFAGDGHSDPKLALALYKEAHELSQSCHFDLELNSSVALAKLERIEEAATLLTSIGCADDDERKLVAHNLRTVLEGGHPSTMATVSLPNALTDELIPVRPNSRRKLSLAAYLETHPGAKPFLA